jgi:predicted Zn-dependent peptidase
MTLNRNIAPAYKAITEIIFPKVELHHLSNGIPVYIMNGGSQDVIKLDVMVGAGTQYSTQKLIAPFTSLMLNEGTPSKTAHQIAEQFDYYGAYFQPMTEKDNAFVGLVTISRYFEQTLPLFYEVLSESIFPEKEIQTLLERRRQKFLVEQEKTNFLAREAFNEQLFGASHPYGMKTTEALYNQVKRDDLIEFYKAHYHAGNFTLMLSGKISDAEIKFLDQIFGQQSRKKAKQNITTPIQTLIQGDPLIISKTDAVQSSIRTGLITVNKNHPDYSKLKILTTLLGGYFGSRLMKNIREEKGYTYGIHGMQVSLKQAGYMAIAADVKAEFTQEAYQEILHEINRFKTELVSDHELQLVRNYMMGEMLQMFDGPFATADTFKAVMQFGLDFDYFEQMRLTILSITPKTLMETAQKYYHTDKLTTVVAGKY